MYLCMYLSMFVRCSNGRDNGRYRVRCGLVAPRHASVYAGAGAAGIPARHKKNKTKKLRLQRAARKKKKNCARSALCVKKKCAHSALLVKKSHAKRDCVAAGDSGRPKAACPRLVDYI